VLGHAVLSFVYNTMTLALALNLFFGLVDPSGPESAVDEFVCAGRILPMEAARSYSDLDREREPSGGIKGSAKASQARAKLALPIRTGH
jgi:hypothetical protein